MSQERGSFAQLFLRYSTGSCRETGNYHFSSSVSDTAAHASIIHFDLWTHGRSALLAAVHRESKSNLSSCSSAHLLTHIPNCPSSTFPAFSALQNLRIDACFESDAAAFIMTLTTPHIKSLNLNFSGACPIAPPPNALDAASRASHALSSLTTLSAHNCTLSNWHPPAPLRNLTLSSCDLSALLPESAADAASSDETIARAITRWSCVTNLRLFLCIPDQIQPVLCLFTAVTHLQISRCNLNDAALLSLLPCLPPHLISIDVSNNPLSSHPLPPLLSSATSLHSLTFLGCRFSPSSLSATADSIRHHRSLSSFACQVDGSASAVRLMQVSCNRPCMRSISIEAPFAAACQHVISFAFPPLPRLESIVVINVPIQTIWLQCVLSSIHRVASSQHHEAAASSFLAPQTLPSAADTSHEASARLHCIRLLNNGLTPDAARVLADVISASPHLTTLHLDSAPSLQSSSLLMNSSMRCSSLTDLSLEFMNLQFSAADPAHVAYLPVAKCISLANCSFAKTFGIGAFFASCRNLTHINVSSMRFDVYRSLYPVDPSTIVDLTRSILSLPYLKRFVARDVMRGHPSSSCSAAVSAVLELLMTGPSMPHPCLELVDLSGNGVVLSPRMCVMLACVQFLYFGRISAGSRNGAISVEISSAAADVRGRAAAASALSLARHTLSKKLMNADAVDHIMRSLIQGWKSCRPDPLDLPATRFQSHFQ